MTPDDFQPPFVISADLCCMFSRVVTRSFTTLHIPSRVTGYRTMAGLPFTHLKEETDLAILAVLRACRLYVC